MLWALPRHAALGHQPNTLCYGPLPGQTASRHAALGYSQHPVLRPPAGEMCAYKGSLLPAVAAASAAERRAAAQDPSQLPTPGQTASLLYGRIAGDARPPPSVPLYL